MKTIRFCGPPRTSKPAASLRHAVAPQHWATIYPHLDLSSRQSWPNVSSFLPCGVFPHSPLSFFNLLLWSPLGAATEMIRATFQGGTQALANMAKHWEPPRALTDIPRTPKDEHPRMSTQGGSDVQVNWRIPELLLRARF